MGEGFRLEEIEKYGGNCFHIWVKRFCNIRDLNFFNFYDLIKPL